MFANHFASQNTVISNALQTEQDKAALRQHVYEIVEGRAFRGSERSIRFLEFIVEKAIAGDFDSLKERIIGIELFGRSPSYSTSKDAIVRVTASDVRKRLMQHYGWYGRASKFQIILPPRTYIPEIVSGRSDKLQLTGDDEANSISSSSKANTAQANAVSPREQIHEIVPIGTDDDSTGRLNIKRVLLYSASAVILMISFWMLGAHYVRSKIATAHTMTYLPLPWQMFIGSAHPLQIVTSDRGLVEVESLVRKTVSLSQYADHIYIPDADHLAPEIKRQSNEILVSNRAAAVDIPIVVGITETAQANSQKVAVQMAREIRIQDLNADGNFVFLGSPRSNPWVSLFEDQMDFRFNYDEDGSEFIEDVHPRPEESDLPKRMKAEGRRTYSIIAFLPNPVGHGSVLIVSGLDIEGTQASGRLVTDLPRLAAILHDCGVGENGASPYFELLLHPQIIVGASTNTDLAACHRIQPRTN